MDDVSGDSDQQKQEAEQQSQQSTAAAAMPQNNGDVKVVIVDEFLNSGRTGRRNAMGDILDENSAYLSTADLPDQLSSLSFGAGKFFSIFFFLKFILKFIFFYIV